jgi:hypothetical protein
MRLHTGILMSFNVPCTPLSDPLRGFNCISQPHIYIYICIYIYIYIHIPSTHELINPQLLYVFDNVILFVVFVQQHDVHKINVKPTQNTTNNSPGRSWGTLGGTFGRS